MKRLCFLLLTTWFLSLPARADGIPITGIANQGFGSNAFVITSPTTPFSVEVIFGGDFPGGTLCFNGSVCDLSVTVPAGSGTESEIQNFTWINGTTGSFHENLPGFGPGFVTGQLVFPNPGFVLSLPPSASVELFGTIPFSGELSGFSGDPINPGAEVFSVDLNGTASFTISGRENPDESGVLVQLSEFNLDGTATPVPEPSSLLLLGSGLVIFARRMRKAIKSN